MSRLLPIAALAAFALSSTAYAQEEAGQIVRSECMQIAKSGSATGAIVGTGIGGYAGEAIGKVLFGDGLGSAIGQGLGMIAGGAAGESVAGSRTYECLLTVNASSGQLWVKSVGNRPRNPGEMVTVVLLSDGTIAIK